MKYSITEGKLDSVIDSFITSQFGNLEHQMDGDRLTLTNDNGDPLIIILDYDNVYEVFVLDTVYASIQGSLGQVYCDHSAIVDEFIQ